MDVDFKTPIKELFDNPNIQTDMKKAISNITTGLLEKGINKASLSKIFTDFNEANSYAIKYNGKIMTITESQKMEMFEAVDQFGDG
jgi:hypothetical protein